MTFTSSRNPLSSIRRSSPTSSDATSASPNRAWGSTGRPLRTCGARQFGPTIRYSAASARLFFPFKGLFRLVGTLQQFLRLIQQFHRVPEQRSKLLIFLFQL